MEDFVELNGNTAFITRSVGVTGFRLWTHRRRDGMYEARQAIAIMGSMNMKEADLDKIKWNPFHPDFNDNYASGIGRTKEEAIKAMYDDIQGTSDALWAI